MLVEALIRLLVAEHKRRPISGNVLALGKQTIAVPLQKIFDIFKEYECVVNPSFHEEKDLETRFRNGNISDQAFFSMFGSVHYSTLDVSGYENATIIHNLNSPIPKELEEQFDYIIDGGTFDHLFNLQICFENVTKLLKTGGRIFHWNAASNYANAGYLSFSADFFYDYYTVNKFANCRAFFALGHAIDAQNWCLYEFMPGIRGDLYSSFQPTYFRVMTIILAEKAKDSSAGYAPIQLQYRSKEEKELYNKNIQSFAVYTQDTLSLKKISFWAAIVRWKHRIFYLLSRKPCKKTYHKIGWM